MKDNTVVVPLLPEADTIPSPPDVDEFLCEDFPPSEQIIGPIKTGHIVIGAAPAGAGKTNFALALGAAVANGRGLMHWDVPKPRSVLLVDGELPGRELQQRLKSIYWRDNRAPFYVVNAMSWASKHGIPQPNLADPGWQDWIVEAAAGREMVMLDNVMSLVNVPGVSFSSDEFWRAVNPLNLRLRAQGCATLWLDHTNDQGTIFGTKTKTWHADLVFTLKPPSDSLESDLEGRCLFTLAFTKVRGSRGTYHRATEVTMTMDAGGLMDWQGEPSALAEREQAHDLQAQGMKQRGIAEVMGISVGKVNKLLKRHDDAEAYRRAKG